MGICTVRNRAVRIEKKLMTELKMVVVVMVIVVEDEREMVRSFQGEEEAGGFSFNTRRREGESGKVGRCRCPALLPLISLGFAAKADDVIEAGY